MNDSTSEGCSELGVEEGGLRKKGWALGGLRRGEARRAIPFLPALGKSIPRVWYMAVDVGFLLSCLEDDWAWPHPHSHTHAHTLETHSQSDNCAHIYRKYILSSTHTHTHTESVHVHTNTFWGKQRGTESLLCLKVGGDHCTTMCVCVCVFVQTQVALLQ